MNLDQFYALRVNKDWDYDGAPANDPDQCVDLVKFYLHDCFGINPGAWGDAHAYFDSTSLTLLNRFDRVPNNPNDPNQVPPRGAIVIWSSRLPGSGGGGHIAIVWQASPGSATFVSFDENWGGKAAKLITHNWSYVLGWLVPKNISAPALPPQGGDEMITNDAQAHLVYKLLRPNGDGSPAEIAATVGHRTFQQFVTDAQAEVTQRDANLRAQQQSLTDMSTTINSLNETITELRTKENADQDDIRAAQEKISYLTSQLATQHDKLADQQQADVTIPQVPPAPQVQANGLTKAILLLLEVRNKFKKK